MLLVISATSYQSLHVFTHPHQNTTAPKFFAGLHQYEINHDNHFHANETSDDCEICTFNFHFFVAPQAFFFPATQSLLTIPYQYNAQATPISFSGSLFSHRGPPSFLG
jgi:hypothetical protein